MPHYFFDLKNGTRLVDPTGLHCSDDVDALSRARQIAVEIAAGKPGTDPRRYVVVILDGQEVGKVAVEPVTVSRD